MLNLIAIAKVFLLLDTAQRSYPDGRAVTMNDQPITEDVADTYFQHHVGEFNDHISQSPGFQ